MVQGSLEYYKSAGNLATIDLLEFRQRVCPISNRFPYAAACGTVLTVRRGLYCVLIGAALYALSPLLSRGDTIDFDSQGYFGPSTFAEAGPGQTLSITTSVGVVTLQGGVIITAGAGNSLDATSVYATGSGLGGGITNPLTITFPVPVTNFSLEVGNGVPFSIIYTVADNSGHSQSSALTGSVWQPSLPTVGTTVTVEAALTASPHIAGLWNFWIDDISFDSVPEPSSMALLLGAFAGLGLFVRGKSRN